MEIFLWILFCILMIPAVIIFFMIVMAIIGIIVEELPKNKADWLFVIAFYGWLAALIIVGSTLFKGN